VCQDSQELLFEDAPELFEIDFTLDVIIHELLKLNSCRRHDLRKNVPQTRLADQVKTMPSPDAQCFSLELTHRP
jgi:hypothetical protein